ncbi:MAG TPA: glycosyltransferase family 1 protein [Candidatus Methylomirabilis sp.]|nr:glycosyltransferase family 1 protein [Candidatus Methylomirabilis sp.]
MNIVTVTDAWRPQINGVVNTIARTNEQLEKLGHTVHVISPQDFRTVPLPSYPEIRLAVFPGRRVRAMLDALNPDAVHIATEGPLGLAARAWCLKNRFPFTTAFHTQFPEYLWLRTRIPLAFSYRLMRWFHGPATTLMVATPTLRQRLTQWGFRNLGYWSRGVDTGLFRPRIKSYLDANRPIFLYMGRVAIEKNIEAFLKLDLPGTKYVVGSGPDLETLGRKYPAVRFTGFKSDEDLAKHVAAADVFVFPSRTDTFGLVMIEALACGVPVAAYPVQGPADVIEHGVTGCLSNDLRDAALEALKLNPISCREAALKYTWEVCTRQFLGHLEAARHGADAALAASRPAG